MHSGFPPFFCYYSHSSLKLLIFFTFQLLWLGTRNFGSIFSMSLNLCLANSIVLYFSKNDLRAYLIYGAWMLCSFIILIFGVKHLLELRMKTFGSTLSVRYLLFVKRKIINGLQIIFAMFIHSWHYVLSQWVRNYTAMVLLASNSSWRLK